MAANNGFQIPVSYDRKNLYNSYISPSTVHIKNNKLRRYFFKYLMQKAISVFKWTLPSTWDPNYFKYTLYGSGIIAVLYTDRYGVICQNCAPGGKLNLYYRPSNIIVTNPLIPKTLERTIDVDCALLHLQPDYSPITDIVGYFADQLAIAGESLAVNMLNVKSGTVFGANNKTEAEAYKKMYDNMAEGNPAVVIGKNLLDDKGQPSWFPFTQHVKESYVASDILSDMRKIEAQFDTMIGIPNANIDKRERLVTDEVNSNNVETAALAEQWLETLQKDIDTANNLFPGLGLAVDWRVNPGTDITTDGWEESK